MAATSDDLLDVEALAALLRTTPPGVYNARHRGQLPPAFRVGSRLLWSRTEIEAWLDQQRETESDPAA